MIKAIIRSLSCALDVIQYSTAGLLETYCPSCSVLWFYVGVYASEFKKTLILGAGILSSLGGCLLFGFCFPLRIVW